MATTALPTSKLMTKDGKVVIGLDKDLNGLNSIGVPGKNGVAGKDGVSISGKDGANGIDGKVSIGKDGKMLYPSLVKMA